MVNYGIVVQKNDDATFAAPMIYTNNTWKLAIPYIYTNLNWNAVGAAGCPMVFLLDTNGHYIVDSNNNYILVRKM